MSDIPDGIDGKPHTGDSRGPLRIAVVYHGPAIHLARIQCGCFAGTVNEFVNRRRNGTPYRLPKGTPASGCMGSARVGPELSIQRSGLRARVVCLLGLALRAVFEAPGFIPGLNDFAMVG